MKMFFTKMSVCNCTACKSKLANAIMPKEFSFDVELSWQEALQFFKNESLEFYIKMYAFSINKVNILTKFCLRNSN